MASNKVRKIKGLKVELIILRISLKSLRIEFQIILKTLKNLHLNVALKNPILKLTLILIKLIRKSIAQFIIFKEKVLAKSNSIIKQTSKIENFLDLECQYKS